MPNLRTSPRPAALRASLPRRAARACLLACLFLFPNGCAYFDNRMSLDRFQEGYTIVLPGVEGLSVANSNLAQGIVNSGYPGAVEIHNWTTGSFFFFPKHLRDLERNRRQAEVLAYKIASYQDQFPGRPVHLVGHSGGAGMALLALEALPPGRQISSAILLQAAMSPEYDLTAALAKTESGIWNFYSPLDAPLLIVGTTVAGTIDGRHTPAAGATGFRWPRHMDESTRWLYTHQLHQVPWRPVMLRDGHLGGHLGPTWLTFSKRQLGPLLSSETGVRLETLTQ